jgi:hypothetical protein
MRKRENGKRSRKLFIPDNFFFGIDFIMWCVELNEALELDIFI